MDVGANQVKGWLTPKYQCGKNIPAATRIDNENIGIRPFKLLQYSV
jgi:hypothetical protein